MKTAHYPLLACVAFLVHSAEAENALYYFQSITTLKGQTYKKVEVHEVTPSGIKIRHDSGTATIPFQSLSKDLQERLGGFDARSAADHEKKEQHAARVLERKLEAEAEAIRKKKEVATAATIAPESKGTAQDANETPPPARYTADALALFSAISSPYWNNDSPVKGIADPKPALDRLAGTSDPLLKEAVKVALALDANQKTQEKLDRALNAKMNGMAAGVQGEILGQGAAAATAPWHVTGLTPDGQPIYQQETPPLGNLVQGLEGSMDAANTQASLNRMSELGIQSLTLSRELRIKVAELARRDLPKGQVLPSPVVAEFVKPGFLSITNRSGKTLHHCLFSTAATMVRPKDESGHQAIANVLNAVVGFSEDFRRESAKQTALRAQLAGAQRGFLAYVPIIQDQETISIPFCDMPSLPAAAEVRLSLWTDEFTGEGAPVAGLQALKDELQAEALARWERAHGRAQRPQNNALGNGGRVNLQPKIPQNPNNPLHQGNGGRIFNR